MLAYFELFPEKRKTELRSLTILGNEPGPFELPPGEYCFREFFCGDWDCDCKQACIQVLYKPFDQEFAQNVATISYTWAPRSTRWFKETDNPFLDPLHPQAAFAPNILKFWAKMVETDEAYAQRLKKHSQELRKYCRENNCLADRDPTIDDETESSPSTAAMFASPKPNVTLEKPADKIRRYRGLRKAMEKRRKRPR